MSSKAYYVPGVTLHVFKGTNEVEVVYDVQDTLKKTGWIGLYDMLQMDNSKYLKYIYISTPQGSVKFTGLCDGFFDVRYFPSLDNNANNATAEAFQLGESITINEPIINKNMMTVGVNVSDEEKAFVEIYHSQSVNDVQSFVSTTIKADVSIAWCKEKG
ncbi:hypothetical protein EIN_225250, partial [Entamoeba invadens IP1]